MKLPRPRAVNEVKGEGCFLVLRSSPDVFSVAIAIAIAIGIEKPALRPRSIAIPIAIPIAINSCACQTHTMMV